MKKPALAFGFLFTIAMSPLAQGKNAVEQAVFVEAPTDTDGDGERDRIYVEITRPRGKEDRPAIFTISPYAEGGNAVDFHDVDVEFLPQDAPNRVTPVQWGQKDLRFPDKGEPEIKTGALERGYASVSAHSLGTGRSEGCPTVGSGAETLAAKAVIDWLGGRAKAFTLNGHAVTADWANGSVGMTGLSYNGTLPNMVATTGVEGLEAIVPVGAISNWYDYYRANGLVVGPGGYIGEDADVLANFIVRSDACEDAIERISRRMGREHGDFTRFWQKRNYVAKADRVQAAVFIMNGQDDWNVRQRHAIEWWNALEGVVPRRMWLHNGGHAYPRRSDRDEQMWAWFDRYVKGVENGAEDSPAVEVQAADGNWTSQQEWPHENASQKRYYLTADHTLSESAGQRDRLAFSDAGKDLSLEAMVDEPTRTHDGRLAFVTENLTASRRISGTPTVHLSLAVLNRRAANITAALVEYDRYGRGEIITRGWADPQNHDDVSQGELLTPGKTYELTFPLEPKQVTFSEGTRIGLVVTATDYEHTLRPDPGTRIEIAVGSKSYLELSEDRRQPD